MATHESRRAPESMHPQGQIVRRDARRKQCRDALFKSIRHLSPGTLVRAAAISFFCSSARFIRLQFFRRDLACARLHQILVLGHFCENFPHFSARAECADFHQRHRPAGHFGDFLHGTVLDFQQCDDQPRRWRKFFQHAADQQFRRVRIFAGVAPARRRIAPASRFPARSIRRTTTRGCAGGRAKNRSRSARSSA